MLCGNFNQSATLTAGGANTFTWSTSATGSTILVTPTITTSYTVTGTDPNGCTNTAVFTQSVTICGGIVSNVITGEYGNIYPNPTEGEFIIRLNSAIDNSTCEIYNAAGKLIMEKHLTSGNNFISLKDHADGIYFVKIFSNNHNFLNQKIIKQ